MKNGFARALAALTLLLCAAAAYGQQPNTDLTLRRVLYFTGAKADKIDTKTDSHVTNGGLIVLKKSDAVKCSADGCYFNFGFFVMRTPTVGRLHTSAILQPAGGNAPSKEVDFKHNEGVRETIILLKLAEGVTKLTVRIDPFNNTPETDEVNNSFSVKVVVKP